MTAGTNDACGKCSGFIGSHERDCPERVVSMASVCDFCNGRGVDTDGGGCIVCLGLKRAPNRMDAPDGPLCGCGKPSVHESGCCGDCIACNDRAKAKL